MVVRSACAVVAVVLSCLATPSLGESNVFAPQFGYQAPDATSPFTQFPGHHCVLGLRKYLNSFTSYQFPNPFPPNQDPLSRLEFPIDQWFGGIAVGYNATSWTISCQGWVNLTREATRKMQDSDWDDDTMPGQKTVFSESHCRLNRGWLAELQLSFATPLERFCNLRPVAGYRYDSFFFTTHDGFQTSLQGDNLPLPGDGIEFKQSFQYCYFGGLASKAINLERFTSYLSQVDFQCQLDYGIATALNEDLHLLRSGERKTVEGTGGHSWHVLVRASLFSWYDALISFEASFTRLMTNGSHTLTNPLFSVDFSFSGSTVWCDQSYVSLYGTLKF